MGPASALAPSLGLSGPKGPINNRSLSSSRCMGGVPGLDPIGVGAKGVDLDMLGRQEWVGKD